MKTEYPFLRYNLFYYAHVLSFYPSARADSRYRDVLEKLLEKRTTGGIRIENPHKQWRTYLFRDGDECPSANAKLGEILTNCRIC